MTLHVTSFPARLRELCLMTLCTGSCWWVLIVVRDWGPGFRTPLGGRVQIQVSRLQLTGLGCCCLLFSLSCCSVSVLTLSNAPPCPHTELCSALYGWSGKSHPQKLLELRIEAAYFRRALLCSLYCWGQGTSVFSVSKIKEKWLHSLV